MNFIFDTQDIYGLSKPLDANQPEKTSSGQYNKNSNWDFAFQKDGNSVLEIIHNLFGQTHRSVSIETIRQSEAYMQIRSQLDSFIALPEGWDSYSARKISLGSANEALTIYEKIMMQFATIDENLLQPSVVPLPDGGVQFEWTTPRGELEVEFHGKSVFPMLYTDRLNNRDEELENANLSTLMSYLFRIFGEGDYV